MALSKILSDVEEAVEEKSIWLIEQCFKRLSPDKNAYIIDDSEEETHLTLLHLLSGFDNTNFVLNAIRRWLSFDNVNINFQGTIESNSGITAAHIAVLNHNTKTLQLLIEFKCDLFLCDSFGNNVQDYAKLEEQNYPELLQIVNESFQHWFENSPKLEHISRHDEYIIHRISPIRSNYEDLPEVQDLYRFKAPSSSKRSPILEFNLDDDDDEFSKKKIHKFDFNYENEKFHKNGEVKSIPRPVKDDSSSEKEIYIYDDVEQDVQFLEERTRGTDFLKEEHTRQTGSQSSQETEANTSIETVIDDLILKMSNAQLREHFYKTGHNPGPINDQNRRLYQKKANRVLKSKNQLQKADEEEDSKRKLRTYRIDIEKIYQKRFCFKEAMRLEQILIKEFSHETESILSGSEIISGKPEVTFFVYLLLDPEITNNLPERANLSFENMFFTKQEDRVGSLLESLDPKLFVSFITSIFYVGKGKNDRPYKHFYDAFALKKNPKSPKLQSRKTERILSIWSKKRGPISLHCFNGLDSNEAFAREFLMIETLGLQNLTNKISGNSRIKTRLNIREREILGTYLLYKAFIILLLNGERQIKCSNKRRI